MVSLIHAISVVNPGFFPTPWQAYIRNGDMAELTPRSENLDFLFTALDDKTVKQ
jgi:hypothetical protein